MSTLDLRHAASGLGGGLAPEMMDALVEIHRVLYRGKQDLEAEGRLLGRSAQGKELRRVVGRWLEADCGEPIYTHLDLRGLMRVGSIRSPARADIFEAVVPRPPRTSEPPLDALSSELDANGTAPPR